MNTKHIPNIVGVLLGLAFLLIGLDFFFNFIPKGGAAPEEGSAQSLFFGAVIPTGFLAFVKVLELVGAALVAIPKTRNFGLLILGPIVINILAYNVFIAGGSAVLAPPVIVVAVFSAYLLFVEREKFLGLLK